MTASRIAVVGAGIFGCATAVELARAGARVELYDRHLDVLHGATRAHQARLHHGYHYPRAGESLRPHFARFADRWPSAVVRGTRTYYAVAAEGSRVTGREYLDFLRAVGLGTELELPEVVRPEAVDVCVRVAERYAHVERLRSTLWRELTDVGVNLRLGRSVNPFHLRREFDAVVLATYGVPWPRSLRYEVCETALVKLGPRVADLGVVVVDGPFGSIDPVPDSDLHFMYHVTHSVHHVWQGTHPVVPHRLRELVDRGPVATTHTRVGAMWSTLRHFLDPRVGVPEYRASLFAVRAVLPDVEATDARPTLVEVDPDDGGTVQVLGGKIVTAPWAAERVVELLGLRVAARTP